MEHIWDVPEPGFVKINVHCEIIQAPLANGNAMSIGALIRDSDSEKLWGIMGPVKDASEEQAIMAAVQAACIHCQKMKWDLTHIETTNRDVFEIIRVQEHIILTEEQLESYRLFNTIHANNYKDGVTDRRISCVPEHMNASAKYMAVYGLNNLTCLVEAPGVFGDLQHYLDRDMGMVLALPNIDILPNFGLGEIEDGPPPAPGKKRKFGFQFGIDDHSVPLAFASDCPPISLECSYVPRYRYWMNKAGTPQHDNLGPGSIKGKAKLYHDYSFYKDGTLSEHAINLLENGSLVHISDAFAADVIDLEAPVGMGFFVKDILHHAVNDTLSDVVNILKGSDVVLQSFAKDGVDELMHVDQVLLEMGFLEGNPPAAEPAGNVAKRLKRGASI
ncbi:hypothetical protein ACET3Z_029832 [Daucus carota]